MGFTLTYNSVDLSGSSYNLQVLGPLTPQGMADPKQTMHSKGEADGAIVQGSNLKPKFATYDCVCTGSTRDDLEVKLDAIKGVVDPTAGDKTVVLPEHQDLSTSPRQFTGRLNGPIIPHLHGSLCYRFQLNFIFSDPIAVATSATSQNVTVDESPESFNVTAAGAVAGNYFAVPVWTITNTNASAVTSITLTNTTRSETLRWSGSLAQNDKLKVNSETQHVEKSTDGGTNWTNAMSGKTAGDPFPKLTAGVQNACTLATMVAGSLNVAYRARYL